MKNLDFIGQLKIWALMILSIVAIQAHGQILDFPLGSNHREGSYGGIQVEVTGKLALCSHSEKGFLILNVTGGKGPYTFKWNTNETTQNRYNLNAGTYTVQITDAEGTVHVERIVVQPPFPLILEPVQTKDASCGSAPDGYAKIGVKIGRGDPYRVVWSHGPKDVWELSDLRPGTYTAIVYDMYNCDASISFEIKAPAGGVAVTESIEDESCSGQKDGKISLSITGGEGPYTYQWNTGASSKDISNLEAGNYEVIVTDSKGCSFFGAYTVKGSSPLDLSGEVYQPLCNSDDGSIVLNVSGGASPYTYSWNTGQTSAQLDNLSSGTYSVIVKDANGCSINSSFTLSDATTLDLQSTILDASCELVQDGSISVSVAGGAAPYTYTWSHGPTSPNLEDLQPGAYELIVEDANGCQISESYTVKSKNTLQVSLVNQKDPSCSGAADGEIEVAVSGAFGAVKVLWSDGVEGPLKRSDLTAGSYSIQVFDENNCGVNQNVAIENPDPIQARISTLFETDCEAGRVVGKAVLSISGGTAPFKIKWNSGEQDKEEIPVYQSGFIQVTITDALGCQAETSVDLDMPAQMTNRARVLDFQYRKVEFSNEPEVLVGEELEFISEISDDLRDWSWDFGDGLSSDEKDPVHIFEKEGAYQVTLTAYDPLGCPISETNTVVVTSEEAMMVVPNAFTPNGDGLNDTFIPKMNAVAEFTLEIFNVWGEKMFVTTDIESKGWDGTYQGKFAQPGNYIYRIYYKDLKGQEFSVSGGLTLVR